MRVLVTGATGFVGARAAERFVALGHEVHALVRRPGAAPAGTRELVGDLARVDRFADRLRGIDAVVHAAALVEPLPPGQSADLINRAATIELARAARAAGSRGFVFVSSVMAIGFRPRAGLVDVDVACRPATPYGETKWRAELELAAIARTGLRVAIVRPPTVYGRGDVKGNFLALARAVGTGRFAVPGRGDNRMSFCHIDNLVEVLRLAAERDDAAGIFHAADERPVTLREIAETIARELGVSLLPIPFPRPVAYAAAGALELWGRLSGRTPPLTRRRLATITSDFAFDTSRLAQIGYRPVVGIAPGVADAIAWYRAQGLVPPRRAR
jgi:nucleoside-diphosphate-sugar epimerase